MDITVSQHQGRVPVTVLKIVGEITADTAGAFLSEVKAAVASGTHNLLLDLSKVPYIASFGIRALSDVLMLVHEAAGDQAQTELRQALRDGRSKSKHVKLLNPSPQVMKVLATSGVDLVLETHTDLAKAVASF